MLTGRDPAMPWLEEALDPHAASEMFRSELTPPAFDASSVRVASTRFMRHRPGRRALIEYEIEFRGPRGGTVRAGLVGKVRAKGLDRNTVAVMNRLRGAGFDSASSDGISVPEVAGLIPRWKMWLSMKVEGQSMTASLASDGGAEHAVRAIDAVHKLHCADFAPHRSHTIEDELEVLDSALARATASRPDLTGRISALGDTCREIALASAPGITACIHRDFYGDQMIVAGPRIFLLDLDLLSEGDESLDVGNFLAHVTEQSLRTKGNAHALDEVRTAALVHAAELGGNVETILVYDLLCLARHVGISTRVAGRASLTEPILSLCEHRIQSRRTAGVQ